MGIGLSTGESYESGWEYEMAQAGRARPVTQDSPENDRSKATEKPAGEIKINRDYKVPYISGPSNDGKTVYIDKSVPEKADIGGVTIDTAEPLKIHELIEQKALKHYQAQGMDDKEAYKKAHEDHAEPAENNWYIEHGIDPKEADKFWSKIDQHTEEEGTEDHPKDLFKAPYPHHKVEGDPSGKGIDDPSVHKFEDYTKDSQEGIMALTGKMGVHADYSKMRRSENIEDERTRTLKEWLLGTHRLKPPPEAIEQPDPSYRGLGLEAGTLDKFLQTYKNQPGGRETYESEAYEKGLKMLKEKKGKPLPKRP